MIRLQVRKHENEIAERLMKPRQSEAFAFGCLGHCIGLRRSQRPSPPQGVIMSASIRRLVGNSHYNDTTRRDGRLVMKLPI
jgi:hypothetical protein